MNTEIKRAIEFLKYRKLESTTVQELAELAGVNRITITRSKVTIEQYFVDAPLPSKRDRLALDDVVIRRFLDKSLQTNGSNFKSVLCGLCSYLLLHRTDLINSVTSTSKVLKIGESFIEVALKIVALKDAESGVAIHSKNSHLTYLKKQGKAQGFFDSLFEAGTSYQAGYSSKSYKLTQESRVLLKMLGVLLKKNIQQYVSLTNKHMKQIPPTPIHYSSTSPLICLSSNGTFNKEPAFLYVDVNDLPKLSLNSLLQILLYTVTIFNGNTLVVTLKNLSKKDASLGRHYNVFTRLRSAERLKLGYINYDISSGLQIISFGLLHRYANDRYEEEGDLIYAYELIFNYAWDPEYKRTLRQQIATELSESVEEVKKMLTAYANGHTQAKQDSTTLTTFQKQSDLLRREVTAVIALYESHILQAAIQQSKHDFDETTDWLSSAPDTDPRVARKKARKKASVFFFIWTYFEKQIRDAMLSIVDDGIPLHDAIYSKQSLPCSDFEEAIKNQTGFDVKISH